MLKQLYKNGTEAGTQDETETGDPNLEEETTYHQDLDQDQDQDHEPGPGRIFTIRFAAACFWSRLTLAWAATLVILSKG